MIYKDLHRYFPLSTTDKKYLSLENSQTVEKTNYRYKDRLHSKDISKLGVKFHLTRIKIII